MVLGCEVGGRWSEESRQFLAGLAATKARSEPEVMRKSHDALLASAMEHAHGNGLVTQSDFFHPLSLKKKKGSFYCEKNGSKQTINWRIF